MEQRLNQRDDVLNKRDTALMKKNEEVEEQKRRLDAKIAEANALAEKVSRQHELMVEELEKVAQLSREEAKTQIIEAVTDEARKDAAVTVRRIEEEAKDEAEKKALMTRLSRIEGQVRGIKGMLEKDAYCPEILVQVSAVNAALNSFNKVLLANHIRTCVADDIREGKDETVDELVKVLQKLMR